MRDAAVLSSTFYQVPTLCQALPSSWLEEHLLENQKFRGSQGYKEAFFQRGHLTVQQMDEKIFKVPPKQDMQAKALREDFHSHGLTTVWKSGILKYRGVFNSSDSGTSLSGFIPHCRS